YTFPSFFSLFFSSRRRHTSFSRDWSSDVCSSDLIAAICAAPAVLDAAGVLRDKTATCYPGSALPTARFVEDRVVEHENVVTSRGPGTAIDFALALVARLVSAEAAREHRERLLA